MTKDKSPNFKKYTIHVDADEVKKVHDYHPKGFNTSEAKKQFFNLAKRKTYAYGNDDRHYDAMFEAEEQAKKEHEQSHWGDGKGNKNK